MEADSLVSYSFCATRFQPSVRRNSSFLTWPLPNISDSRPEVMWRRTSIS